MTIDLTIPQAKALIELIKRGKELALYEEKVCVEMLATLTICTATLHHLEDGLIKEITKG